MTGIYIYNQFNKTATSHHFYHNRAERLAANFYQNDPLVRRLSSIESFEITVFCKLPWRETNDNDTKQSVK